jgi:transcriptional regulator with XRE-family HTH domain
MSTSTLPIGERIRAARVLSGLTQEALAEKIGKTKGAISQIESGVIDPSFETLGEIARTCGMSVDLVPLRSPSRKK